MEADDRMILEDHPLETLSSSLLENGMKSLDFPLKGTTCCFRGSDAFVLQGGLGQPWMPEPCRDSHPHDYLIPSRAVTLVTTEGNPFLELTVTFSFAGETTKTEKK